MMLYNKLLVFSALTAVMAQDETSMPSDMPSDVPSDVPSYVPTYSPSGLASSLPTMVTGSGPHPACPVCPPGEIIGNPDAPLSNAGETCSTANMAGLAGNIPPTLCVQLQQFGPNICECTPPPTQAPFADIAATPRSEECTSSTCTEVQNWRQLAAFVEGAEDGDSLCLCGRFYDDDLCSTTPVTLDTNKQVTLECAPTNVCSYNCPSTAFVVNAGTLSLVGSGQNFLFTGGITYSRILVNSQGSLMASNVVFEE